MLFKDLEEEAWPEHAAPVNNPLFAGILGRVGEDAPPLFAEEEDLDDRFAPKDLPYVLDADASQVEVIEECRSGRSLVVWGPPGTGKSQTIANMIATAVADGKTVLFVAEKLAALNVVHRRLNAVGLGDVCLALHSRKANKRALIEEVWRSLELGRVRDPSDEALSSLLEVRDQLNGEIRALHRPYGAAKRSAYQMIGAMVRARQNGAPVPDFELPPAANWSSAEILARREAVSALSASTAQHGRKEGLTWRGVGIEGLTPADLERLQPRLLRLAEQLGDVRQAIVEGLAALGAPEGRITLGEAIALADALNHAGNCPPQRICLTNPLLLQHSSRVERLIDLGIRAADLHARLKPKVVDAAWETPVEDVRRQISSHGRSMFRFVNGRYRAALTTLRGLLKGEAPKSHADRLQFVDLLLDGQAARRALIDEGEFGRAVFGLDWAGEHTDFDALAQCTAWFDDANTLFKRWNLADAVQSISDFPRLLELGVQLRARALEGRAALDDLHAELAIDGADAFATNDWSEVELDTAIDRLSALAADSSGYAAWMAVRRNDVRCRQLDLTHFADRLANGALAPPQAPEVFDFVLAEAQWKSAVRESPLLDQFDGAQRTASIQRFRDLEALRRQLACQAVLAAHSAAMPRSTTASGEIGILREELNKKRRLRSIRRLMSDAGRAIQKIKPVFLMSPLSVAQFLAPGAVDFDLLLIDEASQVRPEDALGAIGRARQVVVVGDDRQLPPTSFFDKRMQDEFDDDEEDDEADQRLLGGRPKDMESILTLCDSTMPRRPLQWHYRSKHPSLINVSNVEFYRQTLKLAPSPDTERADRGLVLKRVPGVYIPSGRRYDPSGGRPSSNPSEAAAVAEAVITHARRSLAGDTDLSLMVAALSVSQRDTILDEIDKLRRQYPELEPFFAEDGPEPFSVRNLENVQGDERDIVFVSIGYGPIERGAKLHSMSFGPVNQEGGARRLNVLFTRARERCVVFCSFDPVDIDLQRTGSEGVRILRRFLYTAKGDGSGGPEETGGDFESEFEEAVATTIRDLGYRVEAQVGSVGFRIDLAVRHPDQPGRFMLGVECDGATYHSSRWARERDRIREQVLVDNGWRIHRIWSTDWFRRREAEVAQLSRVLQEAQQALPQRHSAAPSASAAAVFVEREGSLVDESLATPRPYTKSNPKVEIREYQPHTYPPRLMADLVTRIVTDEGPVHEEEVGRRVSELWGLQRAGSRIQAAASKGLRDAARLAQLRVEGGFWSTADAVNRPHPRSRRNVDSVTLRRPEFLPPREIEAALLQVIDDSVSISSEDAIVEVSRLLGFDRAGQTIQAVVATAIANLIRTREIADVDGMLLVARP
jgi:very-short-patch-repair endonuclease